MLKLELNVNIKIFLNPGDSFNNTSYSSTTMPNLSLNTSAVCLPLPLETDGNILIACSLISEKPLQISYFYDTMILLKILFLKILIDLSQKKYKINKLLFNVTMIKFQMLKSI